MRADNPGVSCKESTELGYGWLARGDRTPLEIRVPFNRPTVRQVYDALPFVRRYFIYWLKHLNKKEALFINTFQPLKHKPYYGVPCGAIGCGSIGRDFRGGFCKFGLRPGIVEQEVDVIKADQFILTLRMKGINGEWSTVYQKVLCAATLPTCSKNELALWDFSISPKNIMYRGLYPRSWTYYHIPEYNFTLCIRQISPVLPNNYEDSSLPVSVFVIDAENSSDNDLDVSITFTFRNGTGFYKWSDEGLCTSETFVNDSGTCKVNGVSLLHTISKMRCTYAIASISNENSRISCCDGFDPCGSGKEIWNSLLENGHLTCYGDKKEGRQLGIGVCVQKLLKAKTKADECMVFVLSWDMPIVQFGSRQRFYKRRYTRFFGDKGNVAPRICSHALAKYSEWEADIDNWQNTVLLHSGLPDWYKSALFNELYYITDGGSVWFEYDTEWKEQEPHLSTYSIELMKQFGRFGYLESWEYRMMNSYDVHFYASFALAQLWPNLEHVLQAEFADQVNLFDERLVLYHMEGDRAPKKSSARVPHDLGNPAADPWLFTNAYLIHDTSKWKDLNLKFILTSCRDYFCVLNKDRNFLQKIWSTVKHLIAEALEHWDEDGDGMIENFGAADQTYDAWKMSGVSAYCGSLWLAALRAAASLAEELGDSIAVHRYMDVLTRARNAYENRLWNGEYYNFDERSRSAKTIMADQLCGYWFLQSISKGLSDNLLPAAHVKSVLDKIYNYNVKRFCDGRMGAVNGMRKDGTIDRNYAQADEMWIGVNYALAAFFVQQGDTERAFEIAFGCYDACYNRCGLQYQTPEALYEERYYRAIGYMRPLSIWSIQWALNKYANAFSETIENSVTTNKEEILSNDDLYCENSEAQNMSEAGSSTNPSEASTTSANFSI